MREITFTLAFSMMLTFTFVANAQTTTMKDAISSNFFLTDYYTNHLPDDSDRTFASTDLWEPGWGIAYGRNINKFINLNIPLHVRKSKVPQIDDEGFTKSDLLLIGLDATAHIGNWEQKGWFKPYLLAGVGATYVEKLSQVDVAIPLGGGFNIRLGKRDHYNAYLNIQSQFRLTLDDYRRNYMHGIGIVFPLGTGVVPPAPPKDTDGDGITDESDKCPMIPGVPSLGGCPDKDNDGVADKDDACPDVAGTANLKGCPDGDDDGIADANDDCPTVAGIVAFNGCPDTDGDGIVDSKDDCPTEPGPESSDGCPIAVVLDADGDAVVDEDDKCPNEFGPIENNGCPYPDRDNDGVFDKDDKCPDSAGPSSNRGCPELKVEDVETLNFAAQNIYFDTGKSIMKSSSFEIMDKVADILSRYPAYNCSIGGHTDSVGNAASNQNLSEKRAKACYDYLVSKGISGTRLNFTGYGETQPIADNKFKDGRNQNRRVEFNVYLK